MTTDTATQAPITAPEFATYVTTWSVGVKTDRGFRNYTLHSWVIAGHTFITAGTASTVYNPCDRCAGTGTYPSALWDGVCLGCNGYGLAKSVDSFANALRLATNRNNAAERAERKRNAAMMAQRGEFAVWALAHQDLIRTLAPVDRTSGFLGSLAERVGNMDILTERQVAAVAKVLADREAAKAVKVAAGHYGTVGQRAELDVTVVAVKEFDGDYGTKYLVTMRTEAGHVIKTWATGAFGWDAFRAVVTEDGMRPTGVRIKATVKSHGEYNGAPETTVTRVAVVAWSE